MLRRRELWSAVAAGGAWPGLLHAQAGPVRIGVGGPPGGGTDTLARELAPERGRQLVRTARPE